MKLNVPFRHISPKIKEWSGFILFVILMFAGRSAIADWNRIPSGSMEPTLYVGDLILVNKLAYDLKIPFTTKHIAQWADPERGDIVVFFKSGDHQRLIKRVVGVPGDRIEMQNNVLVINGKKIKYQENRTPLEYELPSEEQYNAVIEIEELGEKSHLIMELPNQYAMRSFAPAQIPEGKFLMLGDNRDGSADSRYFGLVSRDQIVGKAERVIISWDKEDWYKPRLDRFFQQLV